MKPTLLPYLICLQCGGSYTVQTQTADGPEIIEGALTCPAGHVVPIRRGIPRFVGGDHVTAKAFAYSWSSFPHLHAYEAEQFLGWIYPVQSKDFEGKLVLDAGCGKGQHISVAARYGAREVIGVDLSFAGDLAFEHTRAIPNAHIIQADIAHLPLRSEFDLIYSVGVLHHMDNPREGYTALAKLLKPGGLLSTWFYAREGNGWVIYFLNPIRKYFTSRIPHRILFLLAFFPAVLVWFWSRFVRFAYDLGIRLPYHEYLRWFAAYPFHTNYLITFDHLIAPVAYYLPEGELRSYAREAGLTITAMDWFRKMSWRMHAKKEVGDQKSEVG